DGDAGYTVFHSSRALNDGAFHHVALVRHGGSLSLYVDGTLDRTISTEGTNTLSNNAEFMIGKSACTDADGTGYFDGVLDEVELYSRALSAADVAASAAKLN